MTKPRPMICKGCGYSEDRIDGFCSVSCRDSYIEGKEQEQERILKIIEKYTKKIDMYDKEIQKEIEND